MASAGEGEEELSIHPKPMYDWADLKPIPQDDGPRPVVSIAYTEEFREAMGRFRAILAKDERSSRALHLTREIITLNPANYTVMDFCCFDWGAHLAILVTDAFNSFSTLLYYRIYTIYNLY